MIAAIIREQIAAAERDERTYRCDRCKVALGIEFFDLSWVCSDCRDILRHALTLEQTGYGGRGRNGSQHP